MPRTQCRNRHVPDGLSPRTGTGWAAQAPNAGRVRPSTGARCGKAARRDLRGGREVTPAPTATNIFNALVLLCHKFLTGDRDAAPLKCCC